MTKAGQQLGSVVMAAHGIKNESNSFANAATALYAAAMPTQSITLFRTKAISDCFGQDQIGCLSAASAMMDQSKAQSDLRQFLTGATRVDGGVCDNFLGLSGTGGGTFAQD